MSTYLVTGVNSGIGLGLLNYLGSNPENTVIGTVRDESKLDDINALGYKNVKIIYIDMEAEFSDFEAAFKVLPEYAPNGLDVIIHNAGIASKRVLDKSYEFPMEEYTKLFNVNVMGSVKFYRAIYPFLSTATKPFKLAFMSTIASTIELMVFATNGYGISKAGLNYFSKQVSLEQKENGNIVIAMHPGIVDTDGMRGIGDFPLMPTLDSAKGMMKVINGLTMEDTGKLWTYDGEIIPF